MLTLPMPDGSLAPWRPAGTPLVARAPAVPLTRTAFAAAHVISDPVRERNPWDTRPAVDWEATLGFRQQLWDQGLHLAEAMDTAQRGMGVDWPTARELIERTMAAAKVHPLRPRVACGAGTEHAADLASEGSILRAYMEQAAAIEGAGGQVIVMATRALPAIGADAGTYGRVYGGVIAGCSRPVILHWLGEMFDPHLAGYWGTGDVAVATEVVLDLIHAHAAKIDGIKISLLDEAHEVAVRAQLPDGVRLYTGDDFNYAPLIAGDGVRHSHALLGIFAAIAPAAAQALEALAMGDRATYDRLLAPTVPLSREIFAAPTRFYKAGIAFLSWLNGHQRHFVMPAGFQSARDITHYATVMRLADAAGLLADPDLAVGRMRHLLALHGVE
jgi:hypothetical protein